MLSGLLKIESAAIKEGGCSIDKLLADNDGLSLIDLFVVSYNSGYYGGLFYPGRSDPFTYVDLITGMWSS